MPRHCATNIPARSAMNRGDRREPVFQDDADRTRFRQISGEACGKTAWQLHAQATRPELVSKVRSDPFMHSLQDRSAHPAWPRTGPAGLPEDWKPAMWHPEWWDFFNDWEVTPSSGSGSDIFWHNWYLMHQNPLYNRWENMQAQWDHLHTARQATETNSTFSIADFVVEVRQSCVCRNIMLTHP